MYQIWLVTSWFSLTSLTLLPWIAKFLPRPVVLLVIIPSKVFILTARTDRQHAWFDPPKSTKNKLKIIEVYKPQFLYILHTVLILLQKSSKIYRKTCFWGILTYSIVFRKLARNLVSDNQLYHATRLSPRSPATTRTLCDALFYDSSRWLVSTVWAHQIPHPPALTWQIMWDFVTDESSSNIEYCAFFVVEERSMNCWKPSSIEQQDRGFWWILGSRAP